MAVATQPRRMSRVELGKIALRVLSHLFLQENIGIEAIKRIVREAGAHPEHVTLFAARLLQQNSWFERRCEELALLTVIRLMEHSLINRSVIANAAARLTSSVEDWESFTSQCLQMLHRPPKEARNSALEL